MKILQWKKKILPLRNDDFGATRYAMDAWRASMGADSDKITFLADTAGMGAISIEES